MVVQTEGFVLNVAGFNDKLHLLFSKIVDMIFTLTVRAVLAPWGSATALCNPRCLVTSVVVLRGSSRTSCSRFTASKRSGLTGTSPWSSRTSTACTTSTACSRWYVDGVERASLSSYHTCPAACRPSNHAPLPLHGGADVSVGAYNFCSQPRYHNDTKLGPIAAVTPADLRAFIPRLLSRVRIRTSTFSAVYALSLMDQARGLLSLLLLGGPDVCNWPGVR